MVDSWNDDLKNWATRIASAADDWADAGIRRLRNRFGNPGVPKIQPYMGYATKDTIRLHGRVLTNPVIEPDFANDDWWRNLVNSVQRFSSDEVPGVHVRATIGEMKASAVSDAEGYFHIDIPRDVENGQQLFWAHARLQISGHTAVSLEASSAFCQVMFTPPAAEYGIISDVDDTILHTGATDIGTMAKLTFFGNARTRAPLDGVAKLYELMQREGDPAQLPKNPIFYVSSSPWNLYDLLEDFLDINAIPKGPLLLRDLGFDANKFISEGHDHKLDKARELMNRFHDLPFVLFGDSGQEDARLYSLAAEEFGDRIKAIFIRDINPDVASEQDQVTNQLIERSSSAGVPMHLVNDRAQVAELALRYGLLPEIAIAPINDATQRDKARQRGFV